MQFLLTLSLIKLHRAFSQHNNNPLFKVIMEKILEGQTIV